MSKRRITTIGAGLALLLGAASWVAPSAGAAEGFDLTPSHAVVSTDFTITASLPDGGTPCTKDAGVRINLLPPAGQGDGIITQNGQGDPSPGGIWTIQLDIVAANIATPGDYRVQVTCAGQDFDYGPEILSVTEPAPTTVAPTTTVVPTTAPPAATKAVAASPAFTG
jgi:hypothetical protein